MGNGWKWIGRLLWNMSPTASSRFASRHGADSIGALATPHQTVEELYLLQKLMRGLGTGNVDSRLAQADFRLDASLQGAPWLGMAVADNQQAATGAGDRQHIAQ